MATFEGIEFDYALHPLPPGRMGFRRWRWEIWHGRSLIAAGWRLDRTGAARAIQSHGMRVAMRMFGLHRAAPALPEPVSDLPPGHSVRVRTDAVSFLLVPRGLEARPALAAVDA